LTSGRISARPVERRLIPTAIGLLLFMISLPSAPLASDDDLLASLARSGNRVLIAEFGLGRCMQCKAQSGILEKVRAVFKEKVLIRVVNVNREPSLTARYEIEMIPHLIFFTPSGKIAYRKTGVMQYEEISAQLSRMGVKP
jgi:thioredoxin 1